MLNRFIQAMANLSVLRPFRTLKRAGGNLKFGWLFAPVKRHVNLAVRHGPIAAWRVGTFGKRRDGRVAVARVIVFVCNNFKVEAVLDHSEIHNI
jgi:hypothetical protein